MLNTRSRSALTQLRTRLTSRFGARSALLALASTAAMGCERGDPNTCEYWTARIGITHKERTVIEKLGKMKCTTEAPALIEFYPKALYRTEITKTLEGFGNIDKTLRPKVMPVIRHALKDREASPLAAQIVKSWQLREAVPDVEELIRSYSNPSARENLVNTLLAFMKPQEIVETLVFLVGEDPTTQGIQVNQLAADKLKQIDWKAVKPEVRKDAIDRLIMALFMVDAQGQTSYQAAREALGAIGPEAGPALVQALDGKHDRLTQTAETYGIPRWQHRDGPELVEVLWDVGNKDSAVAVINSMARAGNRMPPEVALLPPEKQQRWSDTNSNRMVMGSFILAFLRNDDVIPKAKDILLRPQPWVHQFMHTGNALALMGTTASRTALFDIFDLLGQRKNVLNQANLMTAMTLALTPDLLPRYEAVAITEPTDEALKAATQELRDAAKDALPYSYYLTVKNCGADPACYVKLLEAEKGKLEGLRNAISDAIGAVEKSNIEYGDKVKPLREEFQEKSKKLDELRPIVTSEEMKASKDKAQQEAFEKARVEYNAIIERMEVIQKERSALNEQITKGPRDALLAIQNRFYGLEKAVITLASIDGVDHDTLYPLVVDLFKESSPTSYLQFRQWAFVYIERFATPARKQLLTDLQKTESMNPMAQYFSLRLSHLLKRLDRT